METTLYSKDGKAAGKLTLPEALFGVAWNSDLVTQVVRAMEANARTPIAHTKNRAEVSGTGKKPWKQKGTGNARHGSRRSPIWTKGGVAHGPRNERDYSQKINKKMRVKALSVVLSKKYADGEVLFVESLAMSEPKTKEAKALLNALGVVEGFEKLATKRKNAALVTGIHPNAAAGKSFRNMGQVVVEEARNLNPVELLRYKYLIVTEPESTLKTLTERVTGVKA